jgi:hypothetical protein
MEKIELPKVRDLGQTIGDPFLFARQNFGFFMRAFLYYAFPLLLIAVAITAFGLKTSLGGLGEGAGLSELSFLNSTALQKRGVLFVISYGIFMIASLFQQIYISEYIVLKETSEEVSNSDVIQQLKRDWKVIAGTFLILIPIGVVAVILMVLIIKSSDYLGDYIAGFVAFLLYLFFIYASIPLSNLLFVRLRERLGIFQSIGKTFRITAGNWWKTFVGWFIVFIVFYTLLGLLLLPFSVANTIVTLHRVSSGIYSSDHSATNAILGIAATLGVFISFFIMNLFHVFIGINYFSLSEKYDNFHLRAEIDKIGNREDKNVHKQEGEY